jgi:hypothetical protein
LLAQRGEDPLLIIHTDDVLFAGARQIHAITLESAR